MEISELSNSPARKDEMSFLYESTAKWKHLYHVLEGQQDLHTAPGTPLNLLCSLEHIQLYTATLLTPMLSA